MSLPTNWTDKIFTKLILAYGRDFLGRWEGLELNDVKSDWSHELSGFENHPEAVAYALANLPAKPPTVIEFRAIARRAPQPEVHLLDSPKADPDRVAAELKKLAPVRAAAARGGEHDMKGWARRIMARHTAGDPVRPISLKFAQQALKLNGM